MHKNKKRRIIEIIAMLAIAASGLFIALYNLNENIVFFHPPSEIDKIISAPGKLRVGGLVKEGSIKNLSDGTIRFFITDNISELEITYKGLLPALFRESQGIVAEGFIDKNSLVFNATSLLAKHDENYKPPGMEGGSSTGEK